MPKRTSDDQLQEDRKTEPELRPWRESVPPHAWCHRGPCESSSCTTFTPNSHWGRAATGKKKDVFMRAGSLPSHPTLCDPVDCGLPGFSVREGILQARILARIGKYWLPYPSRALYFLLPSPLTPLSTWCCQSPCDPNSCTTSTLALTGANPSPPGQPQE